MFVIYLMQNYFVNFILLDFQKRYNHIHLFIIKFSCNL